MQDVNVNANKWYSVKDVLPEDIQNCCPYEWVLVYGERHNMELFGIANRKDKEWDINNNEGAHSDTGFYTLTPKDITHWQYFTYPE